MAELCASHLAGQSILPCRARSLLHKFWTLLPIVTWLGSTHARRRSRHFLAATVVCEVAKRRANLCVALWTAGARARAFNGASGPWPGDLRAAVIPSEVVIKSPGSCSWCGVLLLGTLLVSQRAPSLARPVARLALVSAIDFLATGDDNTIWRRFTECPKLLKLNAFV